MTRAIPAIVAAVIASGVSAAATDPLAFWRTNPPAAPVGRPLDIRTDAVRRAARNQPDPSVVATVDHVADRFGVPREVARFHVARESGWNITAANPASTARGLLQPIRGSHAAIIGRPLSYAEHRALSFRPEHNAAVGMAHIRACMDAMPGASKERLWKRCHVAGHGNVGTSIERARDHYARVMGGRITVAALPSGAWSAAQWTSVGAN